MYVSTFFCDTFRNLTVYDCVHQKNEDIYYMFFLSIVYWVYSYTK